MKATHRTGGVLSRAGIFAFGLLLGGAAACGGAPATPDASAPATTRAAAPAATGPATPTISPEERAAQEAARAAESARAAFSEAVALFEQDGPRNLGQVRQRLERVLETYPDHAPSLFNLGRVAQEEGDLEQARRFYQRATEADPGFARGLANLGMLQLADGDVAGATRTFEACLERNGLEPGCNINLSVIHRMQAVDGDQVDRAGVQAGIDRLRFALAGDARNAEAYANLARLYMDLGRLELAGLVCENALEQGIEAAVLHNRLGLIALAQGDVVVAYRRFQRAVALDADYVDALMNIGAMALSFRDYDAAHGAFGHVLAREPGNVEARLAFGVTLRGREDFDGAEREYNAVLEAVASHPGALFNLGILYQDYRQDYPGAVRYYRRFLEATAGSGHARRAEVQQRVDVLEELIEILGGSAMLRAGGAR